MKYNTGYLDKRSERVVQWLTGAIKDEDLTDEERNEWLRISYMDDMLRKYIQKSVAIEAWRKKFKAEIKSLTTAYSYYHKTQAVIGTTHHVNKKYHAHLMVEVIDKAIKICLDQEKIKELPRLLEQRYRYLGMDKDEDIDPTQIQRHVYVVKSDPKILNLPMPEREDFMQMVESLDLDENTIKKIYKDAESVPFKEEVDGD